MNKAKKYIGILVLLLTISGFSYYFYQHPELLSILWQLNLLFIIKLIALYIFSILCLAAVLNYSLLICKKPIEKKENILLTIYSTIINFFGPLQSGPGVRAIYLKKKYQLKLNYFLLVSLFYYIFFALISLGFITFTNVNFTENLLLAILFLTATFIFSIKILPKLKIKYNLDYTPGLFFKLFAATLLQLISVSIIYYLELHRINGSINYKQAITYTGIADLALFVSLTPGALGIRESFLLFSRNIHHVSTSNIISASLIDRSIYVLLLGLLFLFAISVHIKDRLQIKSVLEKEN
jgi:uncharacterized membrane protein YbhN (UPF0104 family)